MNNENDDLVTALVSALSEEDASISSLVQNDFSGDDFDSVDDIQSSVRLPEGAEAFKNLSGTKVHLSDPDLGSSPNNLKNLEVILYFSGEPGSNSGGLSACAKYIDGATSDGALGEGNTRGSLITGYWSLLSTNSNNESYSLLLTIAFLGTSYQSIIKPAGHLMVNDEDKVALRFDFDGDIRDWHTQNGFELDDNLPLSGEQCEKQLPSRIGL